MDKGVTKALQIEAERKIKAAGMQLSAYYMPGLGGTPLWRENALETADLMNQVDPDFIRLRTLAIPDHLVLAEDVAQGTFEKASDLETAQEILLFLESLEGITSTVVSDHILNLFEDVGGKLPEDRDAMTAEIRAFLALGPKEQVLYRIGRRAGLFRGLSDWTTPSGTTGRSAWSESSNVTPGNVDDGHRPDGEALHLGTEVPLSFETVFTIERGSIKFGSGATREVGYDMKALGAHRVMVVVDPHLTQSRDRCDRPRSPSGPRASTPSCTTRCASSRPTSLSKRPSPSRPPASSTATSPSAEARPSTRPRWPTSTPPTRPTSSST